MADNSPKKPRPKGWALYPSIGSNCIYREGFVFEEPKIFTSQAKAKEALKGDHRIETNLTGCRPESRERPETPVDADRGIPVVDRLRIVDPPGKRVDGNWDGPIPVVGLDPDRRPYPTQTLRKAAFFAKGEDTAIPELAFGDLSRDKRLWENTLDDLLQDNPPLAIEYSLAEDWRIDEIEKRTRGKMASTRVPKTKQYLPLLYEVACDLDDSARAIHGALSWQDVVHFWGSWQVHKYLAWFRVTRLWDRSCNEFEIEIAWWEFARRTASIVRVESERGLSIQKRSVEQKSSPGPKADAAAEAMIVKVVRKYGDDWVKHLEDICGALEDIRDKNTGEPRPFGINQGPPDGRVRLRRWDDYLDQAGPQRAANNFRALLQKHKN